MTRPKPQPDRKVAAPRKGRPSPAQSAAITETILSVAAELFLSGGFDGTSMEVVAATAGIPKTTLYKRFPDKGALLHTVLADRVRSWSVAASRDDDRLTDDLPQRMRHYAELMMSWASTREVRAFMQLAAAAPSGPSVPGTRQDLLGAAAMVDLLEQDILRYGSKQGYGTAAPRKVALALMALISGWLALRADAAPASPAEIVVDARFLVDLLTQGSAAW